MENHLNYSEDLYFRTIYCSSQVGQKLFGFFLFFGKGIYFRADLFFWSLFFYLTQKPSIPHFSQGMHNTLSFSYLFLRVNKLGLTWRSFWILHVLRAPQNIAWNVMIAFVIFMSISWGISFSEVGSFVGIVHF